MFTVPCLAVTILKYSCYCMLLMRANETAAGFRFTIMSLKSDLYYFTALFGHIVLLWSQCVTQGVKFHKFLTNSNLATLELATGKQYCYRG